MQKIMIGMNNYTGWKVYVDFKNECVIFTFEIEIKKHSFADYRRYVNVLNE